MAPVIAVIAPGAMGSAVARRCVEHGARVLTSLDGRSAATVRRAEAAGITAANDKEIAGVDIILSIVPPAAAISLAQRLSSAIAGNERKPVYMDCNAVNVTTKSKIAAIAAGSGARFVDAAIIGPPPKPGDAGPSFYLSGETAAEASVVGRLGLKVKVIDGPVGAAAALKMSYAGINKGVTALGAAMLLAATRAGAAAALREELAESQPQLLARFSRALPDMYPKAYRWVAEMQEIADFLHEDAAARQIFEGVAKLYERIAADLQADRKEVCLLDEFFAEKRDVDPAAG